MNKRLLILSGPTHEYIDPVRYVGNASSGKMGKAIAEAALSRGNYDIEFVTGPVPKHNLPDINSQHIHNVIDAADMLKQAQQLFSTATQIIFCAAVADYTPAEKHSEKMAKSANELILRLIPTPDIAKTLCAQKRHDQIAIGFALQTSDGKINARRKLAQKNLDGIVLNSPSSLGADSGTFSFLSTLHTDFDEWGSINKAACAEKILQALQLLTP